MLIPIAAIGLFVSGCGGELTADSTCRDYAEATPDERDIAVTKLAQDLNAPKAAGLGRPNIDNACVRSPNSTLGTVISRYRPADEEPNVPSAETGVEETDDATALAQLRGFQFDSAGLSSGTARELITAKMAELSDQANILPDGVTLDTFSRLVDEALIQVVPAGDYGTPSNRPFCDSTTVSPDDRIENSSWVVTFPVEGDSKEDALRKNEAAHC